MSVEEVFRQIRQDMIFFRTSSGGVTLSGGEPLLQPTFVRALLRKCKEKGVHTAVDTCGFVGWDVFKDILPYVDLFLYDLKHMNREKHREFTGEPNDLILQNLKKVSAAKKRIYLRIPLIPRYNDTEENIAAVFDYAKRLNVTCIDVLPYNRLAGTKYAWMGKRYVLEGTNNVEKAKLDRIKEMARRKGLQIRIG